MELVTCTLCKSTIYWSGYKSGWIEEDSVTEHTLERCQKVRSELDSG